MAERPPRLLPPGESNKSETEPPFPNRGVLPADPRRACDDPVAAVGYLGAIWSPDFDAYASGELPVEQVQCVLCTHAPCDCPDFGSDAYFEMVNSRHGRA
jgi:hypothetical protein